jgi:hypothetical protein
MKNVQNPPTSNFSIMTYVVVSFMIICMLLFKLISCMNTSNFCNCFGMENKVCPDRQNLRNLYREGKLTEYNFF